MKEKEEASAVPGTGATYTTNDIKAILVDYRDNLRREIKHRWGMTSEWGEGLDDGKFCVIEDIATIFSITLEASDE